MREYKIKLLWPEGIKKPFPNQQYVRGLLLPKVTLLFIHAWLKILFYLALGGMHKQHHYFSQQELIIEINYCFFQTTAISSQ